MFTGIIEETGFVRALHSGASGSTVLIEGATVTPEMKLGDSIAVNGVCLTVAEIKGRTFRCDLSAETVHRSTIGRLRGGMPVNLERPVSAGGRFGGHFVQGHVDGVGQLISTTPAGEGVDMDFSVPAELQRYLVSKGSVAVDGISLTVARLSEHGFTVAVIPFTYRVTNLRHLRPGDEVNLEMDVLAKYLERFFEVGLKPTDAARPGLTVEALRNQGF